MTIEMENEMTKDEIQAAKNNFNYADSNNLRMDDLGEKTKQTIRAALQSQLTKNDENVTCGNLSNADEIEAALSSFNSAMAYNPKIMAHCEKETIRAALQSPRVPVIEILETVLEQAEDDGLWFNAKYASEAYLQQELRRLHAVIERAYAELQKGV